MADQDKAGYGSKLVFTGEMMAINSINGAMKLARTVIKPPIFLIDTRFELFLQEVMLWRVINNFSVTRADCVISSGGEEEDENDWPTLTQTANGDPNIMRSDRWGTRTNWELIPQDCAQGKQDKMGSMGLEGLPQPERRSLMRWVIEQISS